jgi:diguanylate cyclase (GGDEF)-like protein/PAS domain S-box-containing protein
MTNSPRPSNPVAGHADGAASTPAFTGDAAPPLGHGADPYRNLLDRVPAIVYIADPGETGRWHYVSRQIQAILGFTAEEWLASPASWAGRLHPEDRERVLAEQARRGGPRLARTEPGAVEYRMLHRDGHVVWIRDDAVLICDGTGRVCWHGVLSDITDRKAAEAELERRARQQAAVARLGEHALERVPVDQLIDEAVAAAVDVLDVDAAVVAELDADGEPVAIRAAAGPVAARLRGATAEAFAAAGVCGGITVQIDGGEHPFGLFGVASRRARNHAAGDVDFVQSLANVLADALERRRVEEAIHHRALHDPLTGLPNRVLFLDRLQHALDRLRRRPKATAAVLFIDLDHFKFVNDSLGHHAGDELLAAVATRLRQAVRPNDTIARFGGDEFGLLLEEIATEHDAIATAERIAAVFARPFVLDAGEHFVTTSIGIALAGRGSGPHDLIRDADAAMYRAKERGRARYELFDEFMRARAIARLRIENDLRRALERDELGLVYQPVVSLRDETVVGAEALVRWDHPVRGPIGPSEFIPIAEDSGLIERIGRRVLEHACRDAAAWALARPDAPPPGVSVNLSPLQLVSGTFPAAVVAALEATGLDPVCLSLEITESLLLEESETITRALHDLETIGVKLVLDDFGTGYASLGYLTRLPLDALKIDRAFVATLGSADSEGAITEAIVAMARALSLQVIGEGIETSAQARALQRIGCQLGQGNLYAQPMAADELARILDDGAVLRRTVGSAR